MFATAWSIRSTDPASVPSASRGAGSLPGRTSTGSPPIRYRPGGMPAAAHASVTRKIRPGAAANAIAQTAAAT